MSSLSPATSGAGSLVTSGVAGMAGDLEPSAMAGDLSPSAMAGDLGPSAVAGDLTPSAVAGDLSPSARAGDLVPSAVAGDLASSESIFANIPNYPEGFERGDDLPDDLIKKLLTNDVSSEFITKVQALAESLQSEEVYQEMGETEFYQLLAEKDTGREEDDVRMEVKF